MYIVANLLFFEKSLFTIVVLSTKEVRIVVIYITMSLIRAVENQLFLKTIRPTRYWSKVLEKSSGGKHRRYTMR
jgi:hypothetical protein